MDSEGCAAFHNVLCDSRRGGGLSVYILNVFKSKVIHPCTISLLTIETLFIETVQENCRLLIISIYRPPSANAILFIDKLSELMSIISGNGFDEIILCGDFNLDILNYDNNENTFDRQYIYKPTKWSNGFFSGILISDISDHLPLLFYSKMKPVYKKSSQQNTNVKYCLINDSTITNLRKSLLCLDLNRITGSDNSTTAMESLSHAVDNTYKLCCPIKSKTLSNKDFKKS